MNRSTVIASVVAATGILVAGSVAGVALVNTATSAPDDSTSLEVVAADQQLVPAASASAQAIVDDVLASAAGGTAGDLPAIADTASGTAIQPTTAVSQQTAASVVDRSAARKAVLANAAGKVSRVVRDSHQGMQAWAVTVQRTDGSVVTGYVDRSSGVVYDWVVNRDAPSQAETATGATATTAASAIDKGAAVTAVLAAAPGSVTSASKTTHQGMEAWAVTVGRADGSVVTGYVDVASGVVFDWKVERKAPTPTQNSANGEYEEDDRESENEHEDEDEDEHESNDDNEGDDDDD